MDHGITSQAAAVSVAAGVAVAAVADLAVAADLADSEEEARVAVVQVVRGEECSVGVRVWV